MTNAQRFLVCCLICALGPTNPLLLAQSAFGNLEGKTVDADGRPLAGATVAAVSSSSGQTRFDVSSRDGTFRIFDLTPGLYDISVSIAGITFERRPGVQLSVGQTISLRFVIRPTLHQTVTVTTQTPILETTQSQVGHVVSGREIDGLPINGRTFQQLAILGPGVSMARQIDPTKKHVGAISVGAGSGRRMNSRVDGSDNTDDVVGSFLQQYSQDAVQEFAVITDIYKAEHGFSTDGLVNAITKSGTNRISGDAFLFLRDTKLNSRTFFERQLGLSKPAFERRQSGGILGGPIVRNRAHFFASFERQDQTESAVFNGGTAFPSLSASIPIPFVQNLLLAKVTALAGSHSLSVRVASDTEQEEGGGADGRHSPEATGITDNRLWSTFFSDNWSLGPSRQNAFLFQAQSYRNSISPAVPGSNFTVRTPSADFFRWTSAAQNTNQTKYQFKDDFGAHIANKYGDHLVKIGGEYIFEPIAGGKLDFFENLFVYDTDQAVTVVDGVAKPRPFSEVKPVSFLSYVGSGTFGNAQHWLALYSQDDWRVGSRLTINAGLRYELQTGVWREHDVPGENRLRESGYQGRGPHNDTNNIAWRIGWAYDLSGSGRTIVRGGSGRFYDRVLVVTSYAGAFFEQSPRFLPVSIANPGFGPLNIPDLSSVDPAGPSVRQEAVDANNRNSFADQWSIGFGHEINLGFAVDVNYVHVNLRNLAMSLNINYIGPDKKRVLFPDLGDFNYISTIGRGSYDALKVRIQRRFLRGFQFQGSYTLSRRNSIPDTVGSVPLNQADPLNKDEFGPTDNQETHRGVLSGIAALPRGFEISGVLQAASARPYSARTSADINGDGVTNDRVEPFNSRRGTPTFTLDGRVTKRFQINRSTFELLIDVFNITNRANFGQFFVGNVRSASFGQPSGQLLTPPRQAQLGVRIKF